METLVVTDNRPYGIPTDILIAIACLVDLQTACRLTQTARGWRNLLRSDEGCTPFRYFTPPSLLCDSKNSLRNKVALASCWKVVKPSGGFIQLHIPKGVLPRADLIMDMIEYSSHRLCSLDVFLDPESLPDLRHARTGHNGLANFKWSESDVEGVDMAAPAQLDSEIEDAANSLAEESADSHESSDQSRQTWQVDITRQKRLDHAIKTILTTCARLRHLGISVPHESVQQMTETRCYLLVLPPNVGQSAPSLRSLRTHDLNPQYRKLFFDFAQQLENLTISGDALDGQDIDYDGLMSLTALRVLLRYLERGQRIKTLVIEQPFNFHSFAASALYDGIDDGLINVTETDPRWKHRREAEGALEERLVGDFRSCVDDERNSPDFLRDAKFDLYQKPPRPVLLPSLESVRINGLHAYTIGTGNLEKAYGQEMAAVEAPNLREFSVDNPTAHSVMHLFNSTLSSDGLTGLRHLTFVRPDPEAISPKEVAGILVKLPVLETFKLDFTFAAGLFYDSDAACTFPTAKFLQALNKNKTPNPLPQWKELILVNDQTVTGADLVEFLRTWRKKRPASSRQSPTPTAGPVSVQLPGPSLSVFSTEYYEPMPITHGQRAWLVENANFKWDAKKKPEEPIGKFEGDGDGQETFVADVPLVQLH